MAFFLNCSTILHCKYARIISSQILKQRAFLLKKSHYISLHNKTKCKNIISTNPTFDIRLRQCNNELHCWHFNKRIEGIHNPMIVVETCLFHTIGAQPDPDEANAGFRNAGSGFTRWFQFILALAKSPRVNECASTFRTVMSACLHRTRIRSERKW